MDGIPGSIQNLGDDKESVGIVRGILQNDRLGKTVSNDILTDHIKDGNGMGCRLDTGNVEFIHLLDMIENPSELPSEELNLLRSDFKSRQTGEIWNINRVERKEVK